MNLVSHHLSATKDAAASPVRPIAAVSPILDPTVGIVVCIPSYRRPRLLRMTLRSLAGQRTSRRFAIVVVENDATERTSLAVAADFLRRGVLSGLCVVEPRRGNCHAINTAFETALAAFPHAVHFLMIDDDEVASPDWLERMLRTAETKSADIIGGPVWPDFGDDEKRGLRDHPAFCPAYEASGPVPMIYGCGNCLIRRPVFARLGLPAFDPRFNFLGGGDADFFARCRAAGMRFYWAAEAVVTETIPRSRTSPTWLALRGLRIGAINYHVQRKLADDVLSQLRLIVKLVALLPSSLFRAICLAVTSRNALIALHPIIVAVGSALAAFGIEPQPHKGSKTIS
jgi:GT2 family glycosyltransferase